MNPRFLKNKTKLYTVYASTGYIFMLAAFSCIWYHNYGPMWSKILSEEFNRTIVKLRPEAHMDMILFEMFLKNIHLFAQDQIVQWHYIQGGPEITERSIQSIFRALL